MMPYQGALLCQERIHVFMPGGDSLRVNDYEYMLK